MTYLCWLADVRIRTSHAHRVALLGKLQLTLSSTSTAEACERRYLKATVHGHSSERASLCTLEVTFHIESSRII